MTALGAIFNAEERVYQHFVKYFTRIPLSYGYIDPAVRWDLLYLDLNFSDSPAPVSFLASCIRHCTLPACFSACLTHDFYRISRNLDRRQYRALHAFSSPALGERNRFPFSCSVLISRQSCSYVAKSIKLRPSNISSFIPYKLCFTLKCN